eukprot:5411422-Amphidinium_carterae.1
MHVADRKDCDGDGVLSVHEFIEGLLRMQSGNASAKHVMSLQYDLQHMWNLLGAGESTLSLSTEQWVLASVQVSPSSLRLDSAAQRRMQGLSQ